MRRCVRWAWIRRLRGHVFGLELQNNGFDLVQDGIRLGWGKGLVKFSDTLVPVFLPLNIQVLKNIVRGNPV